MYKKNTLKNGLKIITSSMPHMQSVALGVWIGVGGRYEDKRYCGMSHLIEHMLFKGTEKRTANMLKESIEGIGGSFNGFTSEEATCFLVKVPSLYTELGLDVLSDMVLYPKLDREELEKEKNVICEEIKMYMDQPSHHVFDILAETMWPGHALGRPIAGYIDTVKNFKKGDLIGFKNQFYQPANILIVACGKIGKKEKLLSFAENVFSMPSAKRNFQYKLVEKGNKTSRIRPSYKDTKQTQLALGFHSIGRRDSLRHALLVLNIILGGNMSSRLFDRLREKKALCYDISSNVKKYRETGAFVIHAGVDNSKLLEATGEIVNELEIIKKNFVARDELRRAKEYARGQLLLALEDTESRMLWLGDKVLLEGHALSLEKIKRDIERVTMDDIKKVTNIIFKRKNLNIAVIGHVSGDTRRKLEKKAGLL